MSHPSVEPVRKPREQRSPNFWQSLLILIFRLLLLGVGGGLAWLLGIAIATVYPSQTNEPPLIEKLLRHSSSFVQELQEQEQIPQP